VDSAAWPITSTSQLSQIPDLRGTGLAELASNAAAGEKAVTGVVSRTVGIRRVISALPSITFNSSI
jgi:hypothetical protein